MLLELSGGVPNPFHFIGSVGAIGWQTFPKTSVGLQSATAHALF
jgi:hypothetical protein